MRIEEKISSFFSLIFKAICGGLFIKDARESMKNTWLDIFEGKKVTHILPQGTPIDKIAKKRFQISQTTIWISPQIPDDTIVKGINELLKKSRIEDPLTIMIGGQSLLDWCIEKNDGDLLGEVLKHSHFTTPPKSFSLDTVSLFDHFTAQAVYRKVREKKDTAQRTAHGKGVFDVFQTWASQHSEIQRAIEGVKALDKDL